MRGRCPTGLHQKNWRALSAKERLALLPPTATSHVGPGEWAEFFASLVAQVRGCAFHWASRCCSSSFLTLGVRVLRSSLALRSCPSHRLQVHGPSLQKT